MTIRIDTAMVLAAGLGKRMRPLTDSMPKPMVPVSGKPLIDYALDRFTQEGVSRAIVNVHYFAELIEAHLAARTEPSITFSDERGELLETGGALLKVREKFGDNPFFCTNTDAILLDEGLGACTQLSNHWREEQMDALLLLCPSDRATGYEGRGDFTRDSSGRLSWPKKENDIGQDELYVFTGLQIIHPRLLEGEPVRRVSTKEFWEKAMADGRLYGVIYDGWWMHVGDPAGLTEAEALLKKPKGHARI
ncbi:MAG: nucleotidyltransferase family protein [Aquisalinus sp.]|nr:nucleotidyltransferase family protein [Aquisalinus sp.]